MTLRFSAQQADALEAIAEIQGSSVAEIVRLALGITSTSSGATRSSSSASALRTTAARR
jgi:hypothetical protein